MTLLYQMGFVFKLCSYWFYQEMKVHNEIRPSYFQQSASLFLFLKSLAWKHKHESRLQLTRSTWTCSVHSESIEMSVILFSFSNICISKLIMSTINTPCFVYMGLRRVVLYIVLTYIINLSLYTQDSHC